MILVGPGGPCRHPGCGPGRPDTADYRDTVIGRRRVTGAALTWSTAAAWHQGHRRRAHRDGPATCRIGPGSPASPTRKSESESSPGLPLAGGPAGQVSESQRPGPAPECPGPSESRMVRVGARCRRSPVTQCLISGQAAVVFECPSGLSGLTPSHTKM
jgi:hypothetical protein